MVVVISISVVGQDKFQPPLWLTRCVTKQQVQTERLNHGEVPTQVTQQNLNETHGGFMFGRLGMDYFVNNRFTLSLSGVRCTASSGLTKRSTLPSDSLYDNGDISSSYSQRVSNSTREFKMPFTGGNEI